jgi:hypothetical protein
MQTFQRRQKSLTPFRESVLHPGWRLAEDATTDHGVGRAFLQLGQLRRTDLVSGG